MQRLREIVCNWKFIVLILAVLFFGCGSASVGILLWRISPNFFPPKVLRWEPGIKEDFPLKQPVTIVFDRPMDHDSVERAFHLYPPAEGRFVWEGNELTFLPDGLSPGTTYHLKIGKGARSTYFRSLREPFEATFTTTGLLKVVKITPENGTMDVELTSPILVRFNRPVVDLPGEGVPPLIISPQADGEGEWKSRKVYAFYPRLEPATRYTVKVPKGIKDKKGGVLMEDYEVSFVTIRPSVIGRYPEPGEKLVDPNTFVRVKFDQDMDRVSTQENFSLFDESGEEVSGEFGWLGYRTLIFKPLSLESGATYRVVVGEGALGRGKDYGLRHRSSWRFSVAPLPRITFSSPADGDRKARPDGVLIINFNVPMDRRSVEANLKIEPRPDYVHYEWRGNDTRLEAYIDFDPSAEYRIILGKGTVDRFGRELVGDRSIVFRSAPLEPLLALYGPTGYYQGAVGTYNSYSPIEQYIQVRNVSEIEYALSKVDLFTFMRAYGEEYWRRPLPQEIPHTLLYTWTQTVELPLNAIGFISTTVKAPDGKPLPDGIYLIEAIAKEGPRSSRLMVVSGVNLALKRSAKQAFVWATDLGSGEAIQDMEIEIRRPDGELLASGRTDEDGVFIAEIPDTVRREPWYSYYETIFAIGYANPLFGLCSSQWEEGITAWDFHLPQSYGEEESFAHIYTDRPIYRPGQVVRFKGIARADEDGRYKLLDVESISVTIRDSTGRELYSRELPLTPFGTFYGELSLSEDAALGGYQIEARLPGRMEPILTPFSVAEYRKPEFKVEVRADKSHAIHGDVISVTVQADYYFGAPVADARVRWSVYGSPYRFSLADEWYSFGDYDECYWYWGRERYNYSPPVQSQGEGRTDSSGRFTFQIPVDLSRSKMGQLLSIEATIVDRNNQEVSGRTAVVAHKSELYLGVRFNRWVGEPGVEQEIQLIALNPQKEPLEGVKVTVEFYERRWSSVKRKTATGSYYWENFITDELLERFEVRTGADGRAIAYVRPPRGGEYKAVVRGFDGRGNEVKASAYLWVGGDGYINWGMENTNRIALVADKREYEPGEVAKVLATAPFADSLALITVERGGVLTHTVRSISGTSAIIEVPIVGEYAPNVFVSVSLLKGKAPDHIADFRLGYVELKVSKTEQTLDVILTPERERYKPREVVTYTIRTLDHTGKGVSAEVSLGLVDAAVLALVGDRELELTEAFYHRRGLAVRNSQTLVLSANRYNETLEPEAKGGGGAWEMEVRRHFADTAYWNPVVVTDEEGKAIVSVLLPDDLTTWRMRAKAVTLDTKVGDGTVDIIATKEILVRPVLPRFFTIGDKAELAAIVHNYTEVTQTLVANLQVEGLEIASSKDSSTTITVAPGKAEKVSWWVEVPKGKEAKVLFIARSISQPDLGDAIEKTLPIHAFFESTHFVANEPVMELASIGVRLPDDTDYELDELVVETTPSLAAGIKEGLKYLTGYPFG